MEKLSVYSIEKNEKTCSENIKGETTLLLDKELMGLQMQKHYQFELKGTDGVK